MTKLFIKEQNQRHKNKMQGKKLNTLQNNQEVLISSENTLLEGLKKMDRVRRKLLLVLEDDKFYV